MGDRILLPEEARYIYDLEQGSADSMSDLDIALERDGLAAVKSPITQADFDTLSRYLRECAEECPDELLQTAGRYDERRGSEYGYVRKEIEYDSHGRVKEDPKSIMHFFREAYPIWEDLMNYGPAPLRRLLRAGSEMERVLVADMAQPTVDKLAESGRRGDIRSVYPREMTRAMLRLGIYDSYEPFDDEGELVPMQPDVAKRHRDIGGITFQIAVSNNGSQSGFQANTVDLWGHDDRWVDHDSTPGEAQVFFGKAHNKVLPYDFSLPHRVRRVIPLDRQVALADGRLVMSEKGKLIVPVRSVLVMFNDMPLVDGRVTKEETLGLLTDEQRISGDAVA